MRESRAKAFMYTCIGILAVCISVQVLTAGATAQITEPPEVAAIYSTDLGPYVFMTNGDTYHTRDDVNFTWYHIGNVFDGQGPIANTGSSIGDVKRSFR